MRVGSEIEKVRRELVDRCSVQEMLDMKSKLLTEMEAKVDLKEVQQALNDC
jgi:hypothetical protein